MDYQEELVDKLREAMAVCRIHAERMNYAVSMLQGIYPLNKDSYSALSPENISHLDQLIFRFSKLQDSMGSRLFITLLQCTGEDTRGKTFIDILTKLEELQLIPDAKAWLSLRETRNVVSHEYPFVTDEIIDGLNTLMIQVLELTSVLEKILDFIDRKHFLSGQKG